MTTQSASTAEKMRDASSTVPVTEKSLEEPRDVSEPRTIQGPMALNERRAKFVYDSARLAALAANAPIIPAPWDEREEPFRVQFLKVIERQCGDQRSRSPEELHGSWMQTYFAMGWAFWPEYSRENKTHPDLVPYADLGQLERDKDAVFVALCEIARQWVYNLEVPSAEQEGTEVR